jgi:hypothetical protein
VLLEPKNQKFFSEETFALSDAKQLLRVATKTAQEKVGTLLR